MNTTALAALAMYFGYDEVIILLFSYSISSMG